jgi:hypothetical protein
MTGDAQHASDNTVKRSRCRSENEEIEWHEEDHQRDLNPSTHRSNGAGELQTIGNSKEHTRMDFMARHDLTRQKPASRHPYR